MPSDFLTDRDPADEASTPAAMLASARAKYDATVAGIQQARVDELAAMGLPEIAEEMAALLEVARGYLGYLSTGDAIDQVLERYCALVADGYPLAQPDVAAIRERQAKALAMITALNLPRDVPGAREWVMSIPARPDHDPDLVIDASLRDIPRLLTMLTKGDGDANPTG